MNQQFVTPTQLEDWLNKEENFRCDDEEDIIKIITSS